MAANLAWVLGDGHKCQAHHQPWFKEWQEIATPTRQQQSIKVASLFNNNTLTWDRAALTEFGGAQIANSIINQLSGVRLQQGMQDKLMFTWAKNGDFTIKKAYEMLQQLQPLIQYTGTEEEHLIWKQIWKNKLIIPRVKTFIWKAIHNALPSGCALAKRIPSISPICKICRTEREDVEHILFHCQHARATWFVSQLGLRTEDLQNQMIKEILQQLWKHLDLEQRAIFASIAWQIWKNRCSYIFDNQICVPGHALKEATNTIQLSKLRDDPIKPDTRPSIPTYVANQQNANLQGNHCWIDGSFANMDQGGAAHILFTNNELQWYQFEYMNQALSAFQTEALALLRAMQAVQLKGIDACTFYSDCQLLVRTLDVGKTMQAIQSVDWQAYHLLMTINIIIVQQPDYICIYTPREGNKQAHTLANWARTMKTTGEGFTFPLVKERIA